MPYLLIGWLWFLGTLIPVIGLIQVGNQAMADRYMYIPMIGLAIMVTWAAVEHLPRRLELPAALAAGGILFACEAVTMRDLPYWHDSQALFARALQRTEPNVFALHGLASAELLNGNREGAIADLRRCAALQPGNPHVRRALGYSLREAGLFDEAHEQLKASLRMNPKDGRSWEAMGRLYADQNKWREAADHYAVAAEIRPDDFSIRMALAASHYQGGDRQAALADLHAAATINPNHPQPWHMSGVLLLELNQPAPAVEALRQAAELSPADADTQYRLGVALMSSGQGAMAVAPLITAVRLAPTSPEALTKLAWLLSTHPDAKVRSGNDALFLATRANELTMEQSPQVLDALAAAQAEQRQFDDAAATAKKALKLARDAGNASLAGQIETRLQRYRGGRAARDPSLAGADAAAAVP
jgi:Flp pilus assembly protein TadD